MKIKDIDRENEIVRHELFIKALQDDHILDKATFKTPALFEEHKNERDFLLRADLQMRKIVPIEDMRKCMMLLMDKIAMKYGVDDMIAEGKEQEAYEKQIPIQQQQDILDKFCEELKEVYSK